MALTIDLEAGLRSSPPPRRGTPDGRFVFEKKLGEGAEGSVYLAIPTRSRSQAAAAPPAYPPRPVAVKVVSGGPAYERCRTSRELWPKLVHPNVVFPRESWWDDANSRCFLQMELCQTDLLDLVYDQGALEDERGSAFAGHLASALLHLHSQGMAHQDVKLENIFVSTEGVAKLGDLGSIVQIQPNTIRQDCCSRGDANSTEGFATYATTTTSSSSFVGSVMYAPPEVNSSSSRAIYTTTNSGARRDPFAADMWALGVSLWSAMAGCHPWELACVERSKEFRTFVREGAANTLPASFSPGLRSLLAKLLSLDPRQRPTAAEVLACPWVSAPPTTPPTSSLGATLPSWPSSDDLSSEQQVQQQCHRRRQQQQQQQQQHRHHQHHHHQQQQKQQPEQPTPAPVTPTGIGAHDEALLSHDADSAADTTGATAPSASVVGGFGCFPGQEGFFLEVAEAAAAAAPAAPAPMLAAIEPSPIRSRHRRSKKRKSPEEEDGRAAAEASVVQDRSIGFVLDHHAGQEQGEAFSPEMSALGAILTSSDGGRDCGGGCGNEDAGGERPTKIARVSPSPLTLPGGMKAAATATAAELHEGGQDDTASAFSGLGTQQGMLEFLEPSAAMTRKRQSGRRRRAARTTADKPVPTSARAAAAASASIWGREAVTGSGEAQRGACAGTAPRCHVLGSEQEGTRATAAAASFTTISFTLGEQS